MIASTISLVRTFDPICKNRSEASLMLAGLPVVELVAGSSERASFSVAMRILNGGAKAQQAGIN